MFFRRLPWPECSSNDVDSIAPIAGHGKFDRGTATSSEKRGFFVEFITGHREEHLSVKGRPDVNSGDISDLIFFFVQIDFQFVGGIQ